MCVPDHVFVCFGRNKTHQGISENEILWFHERVLQNVRRINVLTTNVLLVSCLCVYACVSACVRLCIDAGEPTYNRFALPVSHPPIDCAITICHLTPRTLCSRSSPIYLNVRMHACVCVHVRVLACLFVSGSVRGRIFVLCNRKHTLRNYSFE